MEEAGGWTEARREARRGSPAEAHRAQRPGGGPAGAEARRRPGGLEARRLGGSQEIVGACPLFSGRRPEQK